MRILELCLTAFLAVCVLAAVVLMVVLTVQPELLPFGASLCLYIACATLLFLGSRQIQAFWQRYLARS